MNVWIRTEFGVKRGRHVSTLLHPHRISLIGSEDLNIWADFPYNGRPNEDGFHLFTSGVDFRDAAIQLAAIRIALHSDIHQSKARLGWTGNFTSEKNCPGTGSEDRLVLAEGAQRLKQMFQVDQLEHRGALSAGHDQAVARLQILCCADLDGMGACLFQSAHMSMEVALEGENADVLHLRCLPATSLEQLRFGQL